MEKTEQKEAGSNEITYTIFKQHVFHFWDFSFIVDFTLLSATNCCFRSVFLFTTTEVSHTT